MSTPTLEIVLIDERGKRVTIGTACVSTLDAIRDLIIIPSEILEIPVYELDIHKSKKNRILNCLKKVSGVKTVGDLTNVSETRLINACKGISAQSVTAINEALKVHGLRVGFFV